MKTNKGFTLIELMVVVVIIGILAGVVAPAFFGNREKARMQFEKKQGLNIGESENKQQKKSKNKKIPVFWVMPETKSAEININLLVSNYVRKLKVYTLFDVEFKGKYTFINNNDKNETVRLFFPFPRGTAHARDVSFKIHDSSKSYIEPKGVIYNLDGIKWFGSLARGQELQVMVTYNTQGNERYIYEGPGADRAGNLKIEMSLDGGTSELIPVYALQPTTIALGRLSWDFTNLITDRKIIVELPGTMSPTGRVILFLRLAALAVFLFGIGFMYLNDLVQPGRLENFRLGHFLLLALTYSLFFVIFTVLNLSGDISTIPALLLSMILSFPLLMIHVSRFWGIRFSFTRILPLTIFTLGIVINGVYGGRFQALIFIGFTVFTLGFFTLTYKTWLEKRKAYEESKRIKEKEKLEKIKQEEEQLKKEKAYSAWKKSREKKAEKIRENLGRLDKDIKSLENKISLFLEFEDEKEHLNLRNFIEKRMSHLSNLQNRYGSICSQYEKLFGIPDNISEKERVENVFSEIEKESGRYKMEYEQSMEMLQKAMDDLGRLRERSKSKTPGTQELVHCISCGFESRLSRHCPNCGVLSPEKLVCKKCGENYMLPVHMIDTVKAAFPLYCMGCGHKHTYKYPGSGLF